jgi:hypothetical protein
MKILINSSKRQIISVNQRKMIIYLKNSSFFSKKPTETSSNTKINNENLQEDLNLFKLPSNNFLDFYKQLKSNVDGVVKNPSKLDLLIKEKGSEKVLSELENINKLIKEGKSGKDTFRYMEFNEFMKHKANNDNKIKFMMPLFWGWAFPIIKYCSVK